MKLIEKVNKFQRARETMRDALKSEGTRIAYASNIAMLLYDKYGIKDYTIRNQAAEDLIKLIFG